MAWCLSHNLPVYIYFFFFWKNALTSLLDCDQKTLAKVTCFSFHQMGSSKTVSKVDETGQSDVRPEAEWVNK